MSPSPFVLPSLTGRDHVAVDDFPDPRVEADLARRQDGHVVLVDDPGLRREREVAISVITYILGYDQG